MDKWRRALTRRPQPANRSQLPAGINTGCPCDGHPGERFINVSNGNRGIMIMSFAVHETGFVLARFDTLELFRRAVDSNNVSLNNVVQQGATPKKKEDDEPYNSALDCQAIAVSDGGQEDRREPISVQCNPKQRGKVNHGPTFPK